MTHITVDARGDAKIVAHHLKTIEATIEALRDTAAGHASFLIQARLKELEALFPKHRFVFSHPVWGAALTAKPALFGFTDLDMKPDDLGTKNGLRSGDLRLLEIIKEVEGMTTLIEDSYCRNLGRITTDEDLDDEKES